MPASGYIGRFAPTPSGFLHFGSLLAAVASYLDARHQGGTWLVRMEDLDTPRNLPGAAAHILHTLHSYGLHWDGEVIYQSERLDFYQHTIERSEEHTSELQSRPHLVCRLLLEKKKK